MGKIVSEETKKINKDADTRITKLKHQLKKANELIGQMRIDFLKEINQLQNRLAFAYNEPHLVKTWSKFSNQRAKMSGAQSYAMQRMTDAPNNEQLHVISIRYFDELTCVNPNVRELLNYKVNEAKVQFEYFMKIK